jgi:hypothetical protein
MDLALYASAVAQHRRLRDVELLFFVDWYDGPLSGVARYAGTEYWFAAAGPDDDGFAPRPEDRRFFLYPINADELADEEGWHRLYEQHVAGDKPESEKWRFYEPYEARQQPDYSSRDAIGWFVAE